MFGKGLSDLEAARKFKREAERITGGWLARLGTYNGSGDDDFMENPDDWMVRYTYQLVQSLLRANKEAALEIILIKDKREHRRLESIAHQPYKQALLIVTGWNSRGSSSLMTRQRRMELGNAMIYAHQHSVPPEYVNGFIKQAGLKRIQKKLDADYVEPGFNGRFIGSGFGPKKTSEAVLIVNPSSQFQPDDEGQ